MGSVNSFGLSLTAEIFEVNRNFEAMSRFVEAWASQNDPGRILIRRGSGFRAILSRLEARGRRLKD
jgi:hypothetical protein